MSGITTLYINIIGIGKHFVEIIKVVIGLSFLLFFLFEFHNFNVY